MAAANLLKDLGAIVSATDSGDSPALRAKAEDSRSKGIAVETGRHTIAFIRGRDLVVVSPGIHPKSPALSWAREFNIPVISEIELAWSVCPAEVIAITGTTWQDHRNYPDCRGPECRGEKGCCLGQHRQAFLRGGEKP